MTLRERRPPLQPAHWSALALLEEPARVRETLAAYAKAIGHPVYLRPTNRGLTVMSLDPTTSSMVGVGGLGSAACTITSLPPTAAQFEAAARAYHAKVAVMKRQSGEERFVVQRIREALSRGLRLRDDLLFLHHEWCFSSSDKIDLLAIDTALGQLVVIEAKRSEAATREPDAKGRVASEQAAQYAAQIAGQREEYFPYFIRLATALARVYGDHGVVRIDPALSPRCEVWWPEDNSGCSAGSNVAHCHERGARVIRCRMATHASRTSSSLAARKRISDRSASRTSTRVATRHAPSGGAPLEFPHAGDRAVGAN